MNKLKVLTISIILVMALVWAGLSIGVSASPLALGTSPSLGAAASYSVLGHTTVTNTGTTTMPGDLGDDTGGGVTDLGTLIVGPPGTIHNGDVHAGLAQGGNTAAFGNLSQGCEFPAYQFGGGTVDLVGANLIPGVYCADAFRLSGTLILTGGAGDVWIFRSASDFITSATAHIVGGDPCNVWWQVVSSATLGTNTSLIGNILASTSISLQTGSSLNGRALVQTGQVSLDANTIFGPVCLAAPAAGAVETATPLPTIAGLPSTGGAPIQNDNFPWSLVIIGGFSAIALVLGIRAYRRTQ